VKLQEMGQSSLNDDTDVKKVSRFKYATWNIRGLGEKEEEIDKILNDNDIKISVITESKKKLQGTKETFHTKNSQKLDFNNTLLNKCITNTTNIKSLGLTIDETLS
jgi:hypothetical protein